MRVELDWSTATGKRAVRLVADDEALMSADIHRWIEMLAWAAKWLENDTATVIDLEARRHS